jgi:hypothetical protein
MGGHVELTFTQPDLCAWCHSGKADGLVSLKRDLVWSDLSCYHVAKRRLMLFPPRYRRGRQRYRSYQDYQSGEGTVALKRGGERS